MRRICACLLLFSMLLLAGCSGGVEKMFYPSSKDIELYYDACLEVRNGIKREDIKRGDNYKDLFLPDEIKTGMTLEEVLYTDSREAMLGVSTVSEVLFVPGAKGNTKLTDWINQCSLKYTFDKDGIISTYQITNTKSNNTYLEYLYVMRALSLKYDECTTEIYKDGDNIINNTKIREDFKDTDNIIAFFEEEFAKGNVGIISQWVNDGCIITVDFSSPDRCSITYEMVEWGDMDKEDSKASNAKAE